MEKSLYDNIADSFREEANGILTETQIDDILDTQKEHVEHATKQGIRDAIITSNNLSRYSKDLLRRNQPLFGLYLILSMATEWAYCVLIWTVIKCSYLYITGHHSAYSSTISLSFAIIILTIVVIARNFYTLLTRKIIASRVDNLPARLQKAKYITYIAGVTVTAVLCFILYNTVGLTGIINTTLFEVFIFTVTLLFISGVHNVIYSSHFITFFDIGLLVLSHRDNDRLITLTNQYIASGQKQKAPLRPRLINNRLYYAVALIMAVILNIICIRQLISVSITAAFCMFTIAALLLTFILISAIAACSYIMKQLSAN